mgnify:CR=1 FL=1
MHDEFGPNLTVVISVLQTALTPAFLLVAGALPFWESLVTGLDATYMQDGYVTEPDAPGLGIDLNLEAIEANLRTPNTMFLSTDEWNTPKLGFWRPDDRWPE